MWGFDGNPPIESLPVVLLAGGTDSGGLDTVAVLATRNRAIVIVPEGTPTFGGIQSEQIFGDYELTWFDPIAGSVCRVRRNPGPAWWIWRRSMPMAIRPGIGASRRLR